MLKELPICKAASKSSADMAELIRDSTTSEGAKQFFRIQNHMIAKLSPFDGARSATFSTIQFLGVKIIRWGRSSHV